MQPQPQRFVPDPATIWWGPTFRAAQTMRDMPVALPRAQIKIAIVLAVLSLCVSLVGPFAWWHAARELRRIRNSDCDASGGGWLKLAMAIGAFVTVWMITLIVILVGLRIRTGAYR